MVKGQALELRNQLLFLRILASARVCLALSSQAAVQAEMTPYSGLASVSIMTAVLRSVIWKTCGKVSRKWDEPTRRPEVSSGSLNSVCRHSMRHPSPENNVESCMAQPTPLQGHPHHHLEAPATSSTQCGFCSSDP